MMQFPNSCERIAASALLLLSTLSYNSQFSFSEEDDDYEVLKMNFKKESVSSEESVISKSKSCFSSPTIDDYAYSEHIRKHRLKIVAVISRFHDMTFKVVRKTRSKHHRSSNNRKIASRKVTPIMSNLRSTITTSTETSKHHQSSDHREFSSGKVTPIMSDLRSTITASTETSKHHREISSGKVFPIMSDWRSSITTSTGPSSCLSSCSNARSRYMTGVHGEELFKRRSVGSPHIRRRAEATLRFLANGCASEMRIRQVLGDSPDTSKTLRVLLRLAEIY